MDYTKLKGCHPGGDPVGLNGPDGIDTFSSYQAGRDDMITIIKSEIERRQKENYKHAGSFAAGRVVEDADILSFLDTLESEKPKPISTEDMPYITDEHFYEREPADSFKYKLAEYMTKCCTKKEGPYGYTYGISAESILKMAEEELLKRGVVQKPAEWSKED